MRAHTARIQAVTAAARLRRRLANAAVVQPVNVAMHADARRAAVAQRPSRAEGRALGEPEQMMSSAAVVRVQALAVAHREELLAFLERRLRSRSVAEDLVQVVAVRALAGAGTLKNPDAGRAWLFRITRRVLGEHFRCSRAQGQPLEDRTAEVDSDDFGCTCVLANLARLRPEFAFALRRVVIEGVPVVELAKELKLTTNAVNVRVHRARAALRARLIAHCGTASLRDCVDCHCAERGCCDEPRQS